MRLRYFLTVVAFVLSACTPPIGESDLSDLGKSTDAVAFALGASQRVQQKMITETAKYQQLCNYLSGRTPNLLPSRPTGKPTKTARDMALVAGVIGAYADAIHKAAAGGSVAQLQEAATGFKAEAANLFGNPAAGAAINAATNLALQIGEDKRMARIRAIMDEVYPSLVQLERRLVSDAPSVVQENRSFVAGWERASQCVLRHVRRDRAVAIKYYDDLRADRAQIERDVAIANKAPGAVRGLFEVHILVITAGVDRDTTIKAIKAIYDDIKAIGKAGE